MCIPFFFSLFLPLFFLLFLPFHSFSFAFHGLNMCCEKQKYKGFLPFCEYQITLVVVVGGGDDGHKK